MSDNNFLLASHDDLIKLCGSDALLASKYCDIMEPRQTTFDPYLSCASNKDLLAKGHFYTKNKRDCKRALNSFDVDKYTLYFIKSRVIFFTDDSKIELSRTGFDPYPYLMAYENEIKELYKAKDNITDLQKACLYFIETGKDEVELDYIKYIASFDDLSIGSLKNKPDDKELSKWLPECGRIHYEKHGKSEIASGERSVNSFLIQLNTLQAIHKHIMVSKMKTDLSMMKMLPLLGLVLELLMD